MKISTIRPGLLVSLKTSVRGGVTYARRDLAADGAIAPEGAALSRWETTKVVIDPAETERAGKARGKARSLIAAVCSASGFGLLCPEARASDLTRAIDEARRTVDDFNATAEHTTLGVYVLTGRIAASDEEAARAIGSEVRDLIDAMREGIAAADVDAIREAANKARALGAMLTDEVSGKVGKAIEQARAAAREITRRVEKSGEQAARVVADLRTDELDRARFAFLDLDAPAATAETPAPVAAALDFAPAETPAAVPVAPARRFELES
jgi:hypothetical protein